MKLKVTHLKAPWPQGAEVGHVVEVKRMPGWAIGKCYEVDESTEAQHVYDPAEAPKANGEAERLRQELHDMRGAADAEFDRLRAEHGAEARKLKADHAVAVAELERQLAEARAGNAAELQKHIDAAATLTRELADAKAALAAAQKPHAPARR